MNDYLFSGVSLSIIAAHISVYVHVLSPFQNQKLANEWTVSMYMLITS